MVESAYIHIPFCKSKCKYCAFISYPKLELFDDYFSALLKDIKAHYNNEKLNTLYIGGGTPSVFPVEYLGKIISLFNKSTDCEVTVELNPDDVSYEYLNNLKSYGVNRLSMGAQSFNDEILKLIGRRHNSKTIGKAINIAKQVGFNNISIDLIYGLPYQDIKTLHNDIDKFLDLDISHLSTYGLKIEEESCWGKIYSFENNCLKICDNKSIVLPDSDMQADMYELINNRLEEKDFYRYEVSNFAKKGFESKHNLNYWNNSEYYGFGIAAHGYIDGIRYAKTSNFDEYFAQPSLYKESKKITSKEKLEEEIFLGFRKASGIDIVKINEKYGIDFNKKYASILEKYKDFIIPTNKGYTLNLQGVLVSNVILSEFI